MKPCTTRFSAFLLACFFANIVALPNAVAWMTHAQTQMPLGNDDATFTFAGRCPTGESYHIFSYQMDVDGLTQSFYDYEGPAGKGTVRTNAPPRKMVSRICHASADISNGSRYD
jgi:hypothetical protein